LEKPRWWVFGSTKRRNRALWGRFLRLVGYRFDTYPDFSYSLWKVNSQKFVKGVPGITHADDTPYPTREYATSARFFLGGHHDRRGKGNLVARRERKSGVVPRGWAAGYHRNRMF